MSELKPGDRVKLNAKGKRALKRSRQHLREFKDSIGIVAGLANFCGQLGPEVDVLWQPDNLRYAYPPELLDVVPLEKDNK